MSRNETVSDQSARPRFSGLGRACLWLALLVPFWTGCAASRPLRGFPPEAFPDEYRTPSRSEQMMIDLSLLRQVPPPEHIVDTGDVLGIYIDGILWKPEELPPVHFPQDRDLYPTLGYPIRVRADGTIPLPWVPPLDVRGMTLPQVEETIRRLYTQDHAVLKAGRDRILVSLHKPRTCRVLVIRQEAGINQAHLGPSPHALPFGHTEKRGLGRVVHLPAYRNDVLNALAETGGLPGLDAENMIYVMRQRPLPTSFPTPVETAPPPPPWPVQPASALQPDAGWGHTAFPPAPIPNHLYTHPMHFDGLPVAPDFLAFDPTIANPNVLKIPLRLGPGEVPLFCEQDIILQDGDVVFIDSREREFFTTGGLLGGGRFILPRDYDLDIIGAVALAEAQAAQFGQRPTRAIGGVSALNQDVTIGASRAVVLRRLPNGAQFPITVDLYRAIRNPQERVVIQPGDHIVLQYTQGEAFFAFFERHILEGAVIGAASSLVFGR